MTEKITGSGEQQKTEVFHAAMGIINIAKFYEDHKDTNLMEREIAAELKKLGFEPDHPSSATLLAGFIENVSLKVFAVQNTIVEEEFAFLDKKSYEKAQEKLAEEIDNSRSIGDLLQLVSESFYFDFATHLKNYGTKKEKKVGELLLKFIKTERDLEISKFQKKAEENMKDFSEKEKKIVSLEWKIKFDTKGAEYQKKSDKFFAKHGLKNQCLSAESDITKANQILNFMKGYFLEFFIKLDSFYFYYIDAVKNNE